MWLRFNKINKRFIHTKKTEKKFRIFRFRYIGVLSCCPVLINYYFLFISDSDMNKTKRAKKGNVRNCTFKGKFDKCLLPMLIPFVSCLVLSCHVIIIIFYYFRKINIDQTAKNGEKYEGHFQNTKFTGKFDNCKFEGEFVDCKFGNKKAKTTPNQADSNQANKRKRN